MTDPASTSETSDHPNALEAAVLARFAERVPDLRPALDGLRVTRREYTGVGSFTDFAVSASTSAARRHIGFDGTIDIPGVEGGLGAVLFCEGSTPTMLEIYTYGASWDGSIEGLRVDLMCGSAPQPSGEKPAVDE